MGRLYNNAVSNINPILVKYIHIYIHTHICPTHTSDRIHSKSLTSLQLSTLSYFSTMNTNGFWNHNNSNRGFLYKKRRAGAQTISEHLAEAELGIQGSTAQRSLVPAPVLGWRCWHVFQAPASGYHQDRPSSLPPVHLSFQTHRLPIYQIYWCATL